MNNITNRVTLCLPKNVISIKVNQFTSLLFQYVLFFLLYFFDEVKFTQKIAMKLTTLGKTMGMAHARTSPCLL